LYPDLIIPTDGAGPESLFHNAKDLAVDSSGNIYVLDAGNRRVQVFDRNGKFLRTLGGRGQGPGEFQEPNVMGVSDGFVVVSDAELLRASVWSVDGHHVGDWRYDFPKYLDGMSAFAGRSVLVSYRKLNSTARDGSGEWILVKLSLDGVDHTEVATFADPPSTTVRRSVGAGAVLGRAVELPYRVGPIFAAGRGRAYVAPAGEYRVVCFDIDGQVCWDLEVEWPRRHVDEQDRENAMANLPGRFADASASEVNWPKLHPAISHVAVDGSGNLHVFLVSSEPWLESRVPVDVYSPDGTRIVAGVSDDHEWTVARGNHVYALDEDANTGEQIIVRYRLVMP
jgi:hypothetical protein